MSVINLLFGIGRQISSFLDDKKMNIDIFDSLSDKPKKIKIYISIVI